jgi:exosome complex RNA-binding protein Rrp42 (RNase PH superfamily)
VEVQQDESELSSLLKRLVLPHAVDCSKLVVWTGRYVWRLSIDIVILRTDGCDLEKTWHSVQQSLIPGYPE